MLVVFFVAYLMFINEFLQQIPRERNSVSPTRHEFLLQSKDKIYINYFPMFCLKKHRHQLIIEITLPQEAKTKYQDAKNDNPKKNLYLEDNQRPITLRACGEEVNFQSCPPPRPTGKVRFITQFHLLETQPFSVADICSK